MAFVKEKLLTVITESDLEERLIKDVNNLGVKGYTITSVEGKGEKGIRNAMWSSSSSIKVEIVCDSKVCEDVVKFIKDKYLKDYATFLFIVDVDVLCSGK